MPALPLFPLGTVLVPGARLSLRVFEPRYVELLRSLLEDRETPEFGVVAIRAGHEVGRGNVQALYDVGCSAVLTHVERVDDGAYAVVARGRRRFRLAGVDVESEPYLVADAVWLDPAQADGLDQRDAERAARLARVVRSRLLAYASLFGREDDVAEVTGAGRRPTDLSDLSYRVADLVALPLRDRQALLAAPSTVERLDLARDLLRRELVLVPALDALPQPFEAPDFSAN